MNDDLRVAAEPPPPWYRQAAPWLLMAGPAVVVVASLVTFWLAVRSDDGLVSEDYYQRGLNINRTLAQNDRAASLGVVAAVSVTSESLSVRLSGRDPAFTAPATLAATLSHPTRAGVDQSLILRRQGDRYQGRFRLPAAGHWVLQLEDEARSWRLIGNLVLPANGEMLLGATEPTLPQK